MEKKGFEYKIPDLSGTEQRTDRARNLPGGDFLLEVVRFRPKPTRVGGFAIIGEFKIVEIIHQEPDVNFKTKAPLPPVSVGQRVDHFYSFGGEWGYGEAEWAGTLDALGVPASERNAVTKVFLGEGNDAMGMHIRVRRDPPKTWFYPATKKAA